MIDQEDIKSIFTKDKKETAEDDEYTKLEDGYVKNIDVDGTVTWFSSDLEKSTRWHETIEILETHIEGRDGDKVTKYDFDLEEIS